MVTAFVQLAGALMLVAALVWLFGPWALFAGGLVLLIAPELAEGVHRGEPAAKSGVS